MITSTLRALSTWLAKTSPSAMIQGTIWVIPAIQIVHIVSISVTLSSVFLIDLRLIGVRFRNQPVVVIVSRFLPWARGSLAALAVSGSFLIIGEPERSLTNRAFGLKMLILTVAIVLTWIIHRKLRMNPAYWDSNPTARAMGKGIAVVSLFLWSGVVLAGRWIAYLAPD